MLFWRFIFVTVFFLTSPCGTSSGSAAEPLFITIDQVELKNSSGEWVTVVRPDKRLDLLTEEPIVRFFNNGRIPADQYVNVRVTFTPDAGRPLKLERAADHSKPMPVKKGTFIGVAFLFNRLEEGRLSADNVQEIRLTVDEDTRIDSGGTIRLWS